MSNLIKLQIDNVDVFLDDLGSNMGKITISDTYDNNYSYFWGAMGGTLAEFITRINKEYFASKLMGGRNDNEMDVKRTFAGIRKHIRTELDLPFYKHMKFQERMREVLNDFQKETEDYPSQDMFITRFHHSFIDRIPFFLIDDNYEMERVEKDFKGISEPWHFIETKPSRKYLWLERFHGKLVSRLKKLNSEQNPERSVATDDAQNSSAG